MEKALSRQSVRGASVLMPACVVIMSFQKGSGSAAWTIAAENVSAAVQVATRRFCLSLTFILVVRCA